MRRCSGSEAIRWSEFGQICRRPCNSDAHEGEIPGRDEDDRKRQCVYVYTERQCVYMFSFVGKLGEEYSGDVEFLLHVSTFATSIKTPAEYYLGMMRPVISSLICVFMLSVFLR